MTDYRTHIISPKSTISTGNSSRASLELFLYRCCTHFWHPKHTCQLLDHKFSDVYLRTNNQIMNCFAVTDSMTHQRIDKISNKKLRRMVFSGKLSFRLNSKTFHNDLKGSSCCQNVTTWDQLTAIGFEDSCCPPKGSHILE